MTQKPGDPRGTHPETSALWDQLWKWTRQLRREISEPPEQWGWEALPDPAPELRIFQPGGQTAPQPENDSRETGALPAPPEPAGPILPKPRPVEVPENLEKLAQNILHCEACPLGRTQTRVRRQGVAGYPASPRTVELLIVVGAPSYDADQRGEPLGKAEIEYLLKWMQAIQLEEKFYVTNLVKCRTPCNRQPWPEESRQCQEHLKMQCQLLRPKAVLALGGSVARDLTALRADFETLREQAWTGGFHFAGSRLFISHTVNDVLRQPEALRRLVWEDLKKLKRFIESGPAASPPP